MKTFKLCIMVCLVGIVSQAYSQTDKATTKKIVENKNYTFVANSASPLASADVAKVLSSIPGNSGGSVINLTGSGYTVRVTADSVVAHLPYYGRSYQAPVNPSEGGINFNSKKFTYSKTQGRKGSYDIKIDTKDNKGENYRLVLSISQSGYATLVANSIYKQPITYQGFLQEPKEK
ncbi:hypothetical protein ABIB40_001280 [Pedobacter sp. UYP30]|uniref:DUF4251 domain-containing protein n=1 Tax=Pedobacter sp. UYP30 TaxID=1756400 RepID=UPI0033987775